MLFRIIKYRNINCINMQRLNVSHKINVPPHKNNSHQPQEHKLDYNELHFEHDEHDNLLKKNKINKNLNNIKMLEEELNNLRTVSENQATTIKSMNNERYKLFLNGTIYGIIITNISYFFFFVK